MLIAIDARESGTSTGRYIDKLIEYLYLLKPEYEITILAKSHRLEYMNEVAPGFKVVKSDIKEFTFDEQLKLKKQIESLKPDLVHFSMVQQPILYRGKVVTTMHDLTMTWEKNLSKNPAVHKVKQEVYKWVNKKAARKSIAIITPSQFVKKDVVKFTHINPDKITVTYEAADAITEPAMSLPDLKGKQFIMYLGRPSQHKNLEKLIDAFSILKKTYPDLMLVLAGKKDANYERIERMVKSRSIGNIVFTDFISEGQLRWLYENCRAYIFPSLSEGFGLPGLEAMAHGAPVVSSNATCLPEVYGEAAKYFDPFSVEDMAQAISEVISNQNLRNSLIQMGHVQVKKYSWRKMAEQTLKIYEKALS